MTFMGFFFNRGLNGLLWGCSGKIMRLLGSAVPLMYGIWIYLTIVIRVYDHGYTHLSPQLHCEVGLHVI